MTKKKETNLIRPWAANEPPQKVLAIRLQATGDTVITLPYLQALKDLYPSIQFDFLTRKECCEIPQGIELFDHVHVLGGGRSALKQLLRAFFMKSRLRGYDVVIDLQRNGVSRFIRKRTKAEAFTELDRFSPLPAGQRFADAIEAAGLGLLGSVRPLVLKNEEEGLQLLREHGWNGSNLAVLNPAGAFPTRNWPLDSYADFAGLWMDRDPEEMQFVIMGLDKIADKAHYLKDRLGDHLIDLVGTSSVLQAFGIVRRAKLVLSEDSALMHMAWASGVPVVALFGSSRGDWSCPPPGSMSACLHSGDLECGFCMEAECSLGDIRCLTRHTPDEVIRVAFNLLSIA